jgi:hypothetical protein
VQPDKFGRDGLRLQYLLFDLRVCCFHIRNGPRRRSSSNCEPSGVWSANCERWVIDLELTVCRSAAA